MVRTHKMSQRTALSTVALAALVSAAGYAQPNRPIAAPFPNGMCWRQRVIDVRFNPSLARELEDRNEPAPGMPRIGQPTPSLGKAADRIAAMQAAVDAWNAALVFVGTRTQLRLVIVGNQGAGPGNAQPPRNPPAIQNPHAPKLTAGALQVPQPGNPGMPAAANPLIWAADQGQGRCAEPRVNHIVYEPDYLRTHTDGMNAASTGTPNKSRANALGAGWVRGDAVESHVIDARLAETMLTPRPNDRNAVPAITEADILWFTHTQLGNQCPLIQWNYAFQVAGPAPAPFYDYYSVMLHELGHFLGIDHLDQAGCERTVGNKTINNVMRPSIQPGERNAILACEMLTLRQLYGNGALCNL